MKTIGILTAAVRAPLSHWRLALLLWVARLLPIVLVFGLPAYQKVAERSAHHPDAPLLLNPAADATGFSFAWTSDFMRDAMPGAADTIFWLVFFCWLLVSVLAGGITTRLVHGGGLRGGLFLAECGRYAGRFIRLALLTAFLFYWIDFLCNALLAEHHAKAARLHHTQDFMLEKQWVRGLLFLALVYLLGLVHCYARIDMVAHERRSAVLSFLRGLGTLVGRLPRLLLLEIGLLLLIGAAALFGWVVLKGANPLHPEASWLAVGTFLVLAALGSYLRTGVEVGAVGARCRVLVPPGREPAIASQIEAALTGGDEDAGDLFTGAERA